MTTKRRDTWVFVVGLSALASVVFLQVACGTGATACKVVDVASDACTVVRFLGPDGKAEDLTAEDLGDLARAKKQARERAKRVIP